MRREKRNAEEREKRENQRRRAKLSATSVSAAGLGAAATYATIHAAKEEVVDTIKSIFRNDRDGDGGAGTGDSGFLGDGDPSELAFEMVAVTLSLAVLYVCLRAFASHDTESEPVHA